MKRDTLNVSSSCLLGFPSRTTRTSWGSLLPRLEADLLGEWMITRIS